jgi:hypothetical protein
MTGSPLLPSLPRSAPDREPDADVAAWVEGYQRAWRSNDPRDIGALFADGAESRTAPWREPAVGVDAIVAQWLDRADDPADPWVLTWRQIARDDSLAVVEGTVTSTPGRPAYANLGLIRLAPDGRATAFTEWFMDQGETR